MYQKLKETAEFLRKKGFEKAETVIVLGSGLGSLVEKIEVEKEITYSEIPNFPISTAYGHKGNLIYGKFGGKKVIAMQGRFHYYEGYEMDQVVFPIRVFYLLGIKNIFLTNASGGLNPDFRVGDLMLITDHINLFPNPLRGKNLDEFGPRFPDMTFVYNRDFLKIARSVAKENGISLREGVYIGCSGPTFETPAEYRFYRKIGADATGMSTIPEAIVAHHCGIKVFGVSVVTNQAHTFDDEYKNDGADVCIAAEKAAVTLTTLFEKVLSKN